MIPAEWQTFVAELRRATKANLHSPLVQSWLRPSQAMEWMRRHLQYYYDQTVPVVSLAGAISRVGPFGQRGWGACGEAAAVVAAVAILRRLPWYWCIEKTEGYGHVVTYVGGMPFDVYREQARRFSACTFTVTGV